MPLSQDLLKVELQKFSDTLFPDFRGHPENKVDMANKWAEAIDKFISGLVPLVPTAPAKAAFRSNMLTQIPPLPDRPYYEPFTMGYRSPEQSLFLFITHLNKAGYQSNPLLDRTENLKITQAILGTYNIAYPNRRLSTDDIIYNQRRHNQFYSNIILSGIPLPLKLQNITRSGYTRNYENGKLIRGPLKRLADDGLIGDDTILYKPNTFFNSVQSISGILSSHVEQFKTAYRDKVEAQPSDSGDLSFYKYVNGITDTNRSTNKALVYHDYIKKGKLKDYLKFPLDKTQSDFGEIDWAKESGGLSFSNPIAYYIKVFEANHASCDPFWINSGISTIGQLNKIRKLPEETYKAAPDNKKDSIALLEDSLLVHAQNIALSMAPVYTAAAPPVKIDLSPMVVLGSKEGTTSEQVVELLSSLVLTWFKTGIATNNATGVTTTWV